MIQYDTEEEFADYPAEIASKRKRLSQYDDHYALEESAQRGLTSEGIVEVTAWAFVGGIGLVLAVGTTLIALIAPNGDPAVMIVPLVYMVAVMIFMRRRS
jgi:hypothetical protein